MDGKSEKCIPWGSYKSKPLPGTSFDAASKHIVQDEKHSILYIPEYEKFTCDALLIPPAGSADPIVVIDMSIGDPYGTKRSKKYKTWYATMVPVRNTIFRSHEVVCVAVWPQKYTRALAKKRIENKFKEVNKEALGKTYLLEKEEMVKLLVEIRYTTV
jgi:predicted RNase H-like nuclease